MVGTETQAHQEHVEADAELRTDVQDALGLSGENRFLQIRQEQPEK